MRSFNVFVERDPETRLYVGHVPGWRMANRGSSLNLSVCRRSGLNSVWPGGEVMKRRKGKLQSREVRAHDLSIAGEANYVVARAMAKECCVVSLAPLVFFSTMTGDAWVLDANDNSALQLAAAGERLPFAISETSEHFAIEWPATFRFEGERMLVRDDAGGARTIIGYPSREITAAMARARR